MTRPALPASSRRRVARISAAASRPVTATASAAAPRAAAIATSYPSATRSRAANEPTTPPNLAGSASTRRGGVRAAAGGLGQRLGPGPPGGQVAD